MEGGSCSPGFRSQDGDAWRDAAQPRMKCKSSRICPVTAVDLDVGWEEPGLQRGGGQPRQTCVSLGSPTHLETPLRSWGRAQEAWGTELGVTARPSRSTVAALPFATVAKAAAGFHL